MEWDCSYSREKFIIDINKMYMIASQNDNAIVQDPSYRETTKQIKCVSLPQLHRLHHHNGCCTRAVQHYNTIYTINIIYYNMKNNCTFLQFEINNY